MAIVRGALAAERIKAVICWVVTAFYAYLLIEVIYYMGHGWAVEQRSILLFAGTPVVAIVLAVRIVRRISRGF